MACSLEVRNSFGLLRFLIGFPGSPGKGPEHGLLHKFEEMNFALCDYTHGENKKIELAVRFFLQVKGWNGFIREDR
jgi:hypothetical protein